MLADERGEFRNVMVGMARMYERDLDGPLLDAYWLALRAWTLQEFEQAAAHLMANSKWMPRPADFTALRRAGRKTPGEAWALAKHSWSTGGRNVVTGEISGATSGDELVDQAVRMIGGYSVIARSTDEQLGYLERRFCEHYESLQDVTETREAVPQIAGAESKRLNGSSRPMLPQPPVDEP